MSSLMTIFLFISLLLTTVTTTTTATTKPPTVFEWLEQVIVPPILTKTYIKSATLNRDTGEFKVNLGESVKLLMSPYIFTCNSTIKGVMSKDMTSATTLEGLSYKAEGYTVDVEEITLIIDGFDPIETNKLNINFSLTAYPVHYEKFYRDRELRYKVLGFMKDKIVVMEKMKKKFLKYIGHSKSNYSKLISYLLCLLRLCVLMFNAY